MLIVFALFSLIMALVNFVTSVLLCVALRKVSLGSKRTAKACISFTFLIAHKA